MKTYSVENILATWPERRLKKITRLIRTTQDRFPRFDLEPMARFQHCAVCTARGPNVALFALLAQSHPEFPAPHQIFSWDVMVAAACMRHGHQSTWLTDGYQDSRFTLLW
jgi:hypothetical protein